MKHLSCHISYQVKPFTIRKIIILSGLILLSAITSAQFEKKISINLSGGIFKTFGAKDYPVGPGYDEDYLPYLMPNFQLGWTCNIGAQFNWNRYISFELNFGLANSGYWSYSSYDADNDDYYNYMYWDIYDEETDEILASGENYMTLFNLSFGLSPKYYFLPAKKFNPYALLEVNLNYTSVEYIDTKYDAYVKLGREDEYGESDTELLMDNSFAVGFYPGIGLEYALNDNIGFFAQTGYWLILLNKDEFETSDEAENFNAFKFQMGVRLSFWKAKEL